MVSERRELVGFSRTIDAEAMLAGYRKGIFAMSYWGVLYKWWSPDPRGVLPLDNLRVTRSLRKSVGRFTTTIDGDFDAVVQECADPGRFGGWIDAGLARGYRQLHEMGYAHSVETRDDAGNLVGGLFGINIGGFFSGESMFHSSRDASKVALVTLVERLRGTGQPILLDTQWRTEHLTSLGVIDMDRAAYLERLASVIDAPQAL